MNEHDGLVARLRTAGCVFAEREVALIATTFATVAERERAVSRREAGEPLEYVVGTARFGEVTVEVGSPGFIPRTRAVALVDALDQVLDPDTAVGPATAVDLGCGVGAIAACLVRRHPDWAVHACDIDTGALVWARRNAMTFGFTVHHGSWFHALPERLRGSVDVVVAHLPYVPSAEVERLPRDFRENEPRRTVDGGVDGLDPLRAVAQECLDWLMPSGLLVTLVHRDQTSAVDHLAQAAGLAVEIVRSHEPGDGEQEDEDSDVLVLRPAERAS